MVKYHICVVSCCDVNSGTRVVDAWAMLIKTHVDSAPACLLH